MSLTYLSPCDGVVNRKDSSRGVGKSIVQFEDGRLLMPNDDGYWYTTRKTDYKSDGLLVEAKILTILVYLFILVLIVYVFV